MSSLDTLYAPLHLPFGAGYDVPPPSARAAMRVQKITAAIHAASDHDVDMEKLAQRLGIDPDEYDINIDLYGADLYERLLDDLNHEQMAVAQQAVLLWLMPGAGRAKAEEYLADPTKAARPTRAARRTTRKPSTSK